MVVVVQPAHATSKLWLSTVLAKLMLGDALVPVVSVPCTNPGAAAPLCGRSMHSRRAAAAASPVLNGEAPHPRPTCCSAGILPAGMPALQQRPTLAGAGAPSSPFEGGASSGCVPHLILHFFPAVAPW